MTAKRVLIVDDEVDFSATLEVALQVGGFKTAQAWTLRDADRQLLIQQFDLILLDRNLPDGEGAEWLKHLRTKGVKTPVILLTAKSGVRDRVDGLEAGADDYLPKPFSIDELSARIKAVLRRVPVEASDSPQPWQIDVERFRIFGPLGWVKLTRLEFRLASELIQNEGKILSREQLLVEVWGFSATLHTRTVDYFMSRIRKKLGDSSDAPRFFLTHRGQGFEFKRLP